MAALIGGFYLGPEVADRILRGAAVEPLAS
jgi:hypothetical protein